jgi:hypothetical protein
MGSNVKYNEKIIWKFVEAVKIKEACPGKNFGFKNNKMYMIVKNDNYTYPSVGEINPVLGGRYSPVGLNKQYKPKIFIRCHLGSKETADFLEFLKLKNEDNKKELAALVRDLSALNIVSLDEFTTNLDNLEEFVRNIKIEYRKIEDIAEKYGKILKPKCEVYRFCYYWVTLCICLDIRIYKGIPTFIHRGPTVEDAAQFIKDEISKDRYCTRWEKIKNGIYLNERITDVKYEPVKGHQKLLSSDKFVNKKGQEIEVSPYGRLKVDTVELE